MSCKLHFFTWYILCAAAVSDSDGSKPVSVVVAVSPTQNMAMLLSDPRGGSTCDPYPWVRTGYQRLVDTATKDKLWFKFDQKIS